MLSACSFSLSTVFAQEVLPEFTVKDSKGVISISWQNKYPEPVKGISIQRSSDSTKGFSTVTAVNNPAAVANGIVDTSAGSPKMFYRLFITFDLGGYVFTEAKQPEIDPEFDYLKAIKKIADLSKYQSRFVYAARDNNIVLDLPDFIPNKYVVKFFEEDTKLLFELIKLTEGYLIIEKVNFLHAGWFYFEIYDDGKLLEKNKIFIPKD